MGLAPMNGRRFLLMHVETTGSGHYRASRAIEDTLRRVDGRWKIARREIYLDQSVLLHKNLTSFF